MFKITLYYRLQELISTKYVDILISNESQAHQSMQMPNIWYEM